MKLGELFILFGLKTKKADFVEAFAALKGLRIMASAAGSVIGGLAHGVMDLAQEAAQNATHVISLSKAMGMTAEQTQRWGYLAQQSGSNIKELSVGVNMLTRNLRVFGEGRGSKILRDRFRELGISREDARKALDAPDGVQNTLFKISDGLHRMDDGMRKATNTSLFGVRAGRAMLADLERGAPAIKELFGHFDKIGGTIGGKQIVDLRHMANAINDIKAAWQGVTGQIIGAAAPALTKLLEEVAYWFGENRELIKDVIMLVVDGLVIAFKVLMAVVNTVATVLQAAFDGNVGAQALLAGVVILVGTLVVALMYMLMPAIIAIGGAIWAAFAPLLPIAAILIGIAALVLVIVRYWDDIADAVSSAWSALIDGWTRFATQVADGIATFVTLIWMSIKAVGRGIADLLDIVIHLILRILEWVNVLPQDAEKAFDQLWDSLVSKAKAAWDAVVEFAYDAWRRIRTLPVIKQLLEVATYVSPTAAALNYANQFEPMADGRARRAPEHVTNVPPEFAAKQAQEGAAADRSRGTVEVSVGPTTNNFYGVKDASEARDQLADTIDAQHRHAAAALGGEIQ